MNINQENEKQYLSWYYEQLKYISKFQSNLLWIIFVLTVFVCLIDLHANKLIEIPFLQLNLKTETISIFVPLVLSILFWGFLGSMNAVRHSVKNIKTRLMNLGYNDNEFNLYDVDTSLNLLDILTFNQIKSTSADNTVINKKSRSKQLPYLLFVLIFLFAKVYIVIQWHLDIFWMSFSIILIIFDLLFSLNLFKDRLKKFFGG